MTSPTSAIIDRSRSGGAGRRLRAFTLIEILLVVAIIGILAALLLPAVGRARRTALRIAIGNDLQTVSTALTAYRQDFGDYPRIRVSSSIARVDYSVVRTGDQLERPNPQTGAELLCWALMGPGPTTDSTVPPPPGFAIRQDGADGLGFRARRQMTAGPDGALGTADDVPQGKITPAYLDAEKFKLSAHENLELSAADTDPKMVLHFNLLDRTGMPILYFPAAASKPNVKLPGMVSAPPVTTARPPYVSSDFVEPLPAGTTSETASRYDADDNLVWFFTDPYDAMSTSGSGKMKPADAITALKRIRGMLGDRHNTVMAPTTFPQTPDGSIEPYETAIDMPFLLWSAGPDGRFGPGTFTDGADLAYEDVPAIDKCDDVTNFRQ